MNALRWIAVCLLAGLGGWQSVSLGAEVGKAVDVAPNVENSRYQHWPRAAWAEQSGCWLVVWREGDLNEDDTDIYCARVSKDGTPLDEKGIRITTAKDIQNKPVVASDGKDFLVVWQDLRGGKDWDIYGARVSADGKVKDPDGFVVDSRPHNQCLPTIVYAGKQYYTAWQSWVEGGLEKGYGSYEARGARVSNEGKVLDVEGVVLAGVTTIQPSLAYHKEVGLMLYAIGRKDRKIEDEGPYKNMIKFVKIDPDKGVPVGGVSHISPEIRNPTEIHFTPSATLMEDGSSLVVRNAKLGGMRLMHLDKDGKRIGTPRWFRKNRKNQGIAPIASIVSDGKRALMTYDFPTDKESIPRPPMRMKVWGWMVASDGTITDGGQSGFAIAGGAKIDSMQGVPCLGPDGWFLVVYAEARKVEDTKVVFRVIK